MTRRAAGLLALAVALLGVVLLLTEVGERGPAPAASEPPAPRTLPAVTLPPLGEGTPVDLSTVRGPAVVSFWASWCPPCREELPILQKFATRYAGRVDVLGIDFTDPQVDAAKQLVADSGVTYPVVVDLDGSVSGQGAIPALRGLPYLVLLDADGTVVFGEYLPIGSLGQLQDLVEAHLGVAA